jgi:hypothetical protein
MVGITTHSVRNKHNCCGGKHLTKYPRREDADYREKILEANKACR